MKLKFAIIVLSYCYPVFSQGTFENLNFEQANPGPITFSFGVPVSNAPCARKGKMTNAQIVSKVRTDTCISKLGLTPAST